MSQIQPVEQSNSGKKLQPGEKREAFKDILARYMTPVACRMSPTRRVAADGMLAAVYFALTVLTINTGSLKITFASLAFVVAAMLLGPLDAMAVALVGEFLYQLIIYSLTPTTPIWLLPPVLHALRLGLFAILMGSPEKPLVERTGACVFACMDCGFFNSLFNTVALYADSKIFGYYKFELVFGMAIARMGIALATAAAISVVVIPLVRTLRARIPELALR